MYLGDPEGIYKLSEGGQVDAIGWILWRASKEGGRRSTTAATASDQVHIILDQRPAPKPNRAAADILDHLGGE